MNPQIGKVIKVGNSLAITIPAQICKGLKIERGDAVVLAVYDENIFCVRRIPPHELQNLKPGKVTF